MKLFGLNVTRSAPAAPETRAVQITQNSTPEEILAFFGLSNVSLPHVTANSALRVPAVLNAVTFLSRSLASLNLDAFRETAAGPVAIGGRLKTLVKDAPNPEWSSYMARVYFWQGVFLHGRGLLAILRQNGQPYELWPMDPSLTLVSMNAFGERTYTLTSPGAQPVTRSFSSADVIDVPFMLTTNMCNVWSPIRLGEKAIQLAIAMNDYGSTFFAGGGMPPLALEGPLPANAQSIQRATDDIMRAVDAARATQKPVIPLPSGHKLTPVGFDPAKGQMVEARLFQIQEIARVYQIPPVFLQDLSKATFSNVEQQDIQLVKHLIGQWAAAFEQEANLKLFGQMNGRRYIRHDLDSLMRGDFLSRMTALGQGVQNGLITPNEGRAVDGRAPKDGGDNLLIQGATVPLNGHTSPTSANGGSGQ